MPVRVGSKSKSRSPPRLGKDGEGASRSIEVVKAGSSSGKKKKNRSSSSSSSSRRTRAASPEDKDGKEVEISTQGEREVKDCAGPRTCASTCLTKTDFWSHCDNEVLAALYRAGFDGITIDNYGLYQNQTNGTESPANLLSRILNWTYHAFALNGRRALEASPAPERIKRGFFCSEEKYQEILSRVLPGQMGSHWAASDREGPSFQRFDGVAQVHGLGLLASKDLAFFYRGCSFQGLNPCAWAATNPAFWPEGWASTTIQDLLNNALMEITLEDYNVDLRRLVGIMGLGNFLNVTLTLKEAIVAPLPISQMPPGSATPWTCALWFMLQQYIVAVLNSMVCAMNYRFPTAFLLGGGAWAFMRWMSEIYHCLHIPSAGAIPIDTPTLVAAMARIMNYICSLVQENNRGCFQFDCASLTEGKVTNPCGEPESCNLDSCSPQCVPNTSSVNDSVASNIGQGICQCPICCTPEECPPPCPTPPTPCDPCPTTAAPYCFPQIYTLVDAFIDFVNLIGTDGITRSIESKKESKKGSEEKDKKDDKEKEGKEKEGKASSKDGTVVAARSDPTPMSSAGLDSLRKINRQLDSKFHGEIERLFEAINIIGEDEKGQVTRRFSSRLLAEFYSELFSAVDPTNLSQNFFTLNPSAVIESLSCMFEVILRHTLHGPGLIRLNNSPMKIPRTAFTKLSGIVTYPIMKGLFVSVNTDVQSGLRYDYCTMVEAMTRTMENDFWAYYRGKRLEGLPPCKWARAQRCLWGDVDPDMKLSDVLAHPAFAIFERAYIADNRSFTGIPGLLSFSGVTLTLRELLTAENPVTGSLYLDFLWFGIQEVLAGFLNSNLSCFFYRFPSIAFMGGLSFVLLRFFSDAVWALNTMQQPLPPIDSMYLFSSFSRILTVVQSVARENRRGVADPKKWKPLFHRGCCPNPCSCKRTCPVTTDIVTLVNAFQIFMTIP